MNELKEPVCVKLCAYFKPGKEDEPGCGGLHRLADWGVEPGELSSLIGKAEEAAGARGVPLDDPRLLAVCSECDYLAGGCDFRDPSVPDEACSPCGGIRAASLVLWKKDHP